MKTKRYVFVLYLHDWYLRVYSYSSVSFMTHILKKPYVSISCWLAVYVWACLIYQA